jgi:hypothetical protein
VNSIGVRISYCGDPVSAQEQGWLEIQTLPNAAGRDLQFIGYLFLTT